MGDNRNNIYAAVKAIVQSETVADVDAAFEELQAWSADDRGSVIKGILEKMNTPKILNEALKGEMADKIKEIRGSNEEKEELERFYTGVQIIFHLSRTKEAIGMPYIKALTEELAAATEEEFNSLEGQIKIVFRVSDKLNPMLSSAPIQPVTQRPNPFRPKNPVVQEGEISATLKRNLPYRPFKF